MKLHIFGHTVGVLAFFFGVAVASRLLGPDWQGKKPPTPKLISSSADALSNLFRNTIN